MSGAGSTGRFRRVGRRPDHWSSPHERATVRAAERLEAPLPPAEAAWLEKHLAGCNACRAVADAYTTDRLALRQWREEAPEPPRDLWARTAAGIERESATRRPAARPTRGRRSPSTPALGAISGLAVAAVVIVATAISGGFFGPVPAVGPGPSVAVASQPIETPTTALSVGAGKVHWLGAAEDGVFAYNVADVDVVCPFDRRPDCAPFEDGHAKRVTLSAKPKFVFQSPVDPQAIVVGTDANGADAVLVVVLPTPDPTPVASLAPDASTAPGESPPTSPNGIATVAPSPSPVAIPSSDLPILPSGDIGSANLASTPPESSPPVSASPASESTAPTVVAIITDVTIVGRAAAYSPDGAWFAFSARPADGSAGPDIYVWHVGELQARAITTDHMSVFASWIGGHVLGSRVASSPVAEPEPTPIVEPSDGLPPVEPTIEIPPPLDTPPAGEPAADPASSPDAPTLPGPSALVESVPQTFLVDPWTGLELALLDNEWQPAVDPTGLAVVAWQGTVAVGADGVTTTPAVGSLVIHPFHGPLATEDPLASGSPLPDLTPLPTSTPTPVPTPTASLDPSGSPMPSMPPPDVTDFPSQALVSGSVVDFDARWDETGSWLAIWIADPIDSALGRLSLFRFDRATGFVDRPIGAPQDVTALPGFSIGYGRLAWASPPGQEGEGSRIQIAAWTDNQVGAIESIPVEGAIVVQ